MKGNAARLHSCEWIGHGEGIAGVPGFIGRKRLKTWVSVCFQKTRTIFLGQRTGCGRERLNSLQTTAYGGCGVFDGFHRTEHDRRSVFPLCIRSTRRKNVVLLRLILKGRVIVSKRAILAIRGGNGAGGPDFTGLPVLQGKVIRSDMKSNISGKPPDSLGFKEKKYSF